MSTVLIVLYTHIKKKDQKWACYYGGHEEANKEGEGYLKENYYENKRVWINESCFDNGEQYD